MSVTDLFTYLQIKPLPIRFIAVYNTSNSAVVLKQK